MPSPSVIYCDLKNGKAASTVAGTQLTWPSFVAGGNVSYALRFLESDAALGFLEKDQDVASIRVALGYKQQYPSSGRFKIRVGSNQLTPFLDYSCGPREIKAALDSLSPSDPFIVESVGKSFLIRKQSGGAVTLSAVSNTLMPFCFVAFEGSLINSSWIYRMVFRTAPLAFNDLAYQSLPDAPAASVIQHGGVDPSGTVVWNTIQKLYIPPTFRGTFQLQRNLARTVLLDITDGAAQVAMALNDILKVEVDEFGKKAEVAVTNPTSFVLHIEFKGALVGADVPVLGVNVYSAPPGDWGFNLNLDTPELRSALADTQSLQLQFEAEADFYTSRPIQGQPLPPTIRRKLWSDSVTVTRPLIFSEFSTTGMIDWLRPPSGRDYIPFTPDQVITGQQNYTTSIGDGAATTFAIPHHLDSDDLAAVSVRENRAGGKLLSPSSYEVTILDAGSVELEFTTPPLPNSLSVTILAAGPKSAFQTHTHTIQQIVTLDDTLTRISERLAYIESLIPKSSTIVSVSTTMPDQKNVLPPFGELLPDLSLENTTVSIASQIVSAPSSGGTPLPPVVIPGTDLQEQNQKAAAELEKIKAQIEAAKQAALDAAAAAKEQALKTATVAAKQDSTLLTTLSIPFIGTTADPKIWPITRAGSKPPRLPRAMQGTPVNTSSLPTAPGVYRATAPLTLPPAPGRKTATVPVNGVFASDGVIYYGAAQWKSGGWYATDMDRELYRTLISESSFPAESTLSASLETNTSLITSGFDSTGVSYGCEYILQVLAIPLAAQDPGVGGATAPAVIMETPLSFSMASEKRQFTITMARDGSKSSCMVYGASVEGDPAPEGDFTLAVRLTAFDIDDSSASPVGKVSLWMPASQITITR
jgi:hypothetical protein